jgi:hypothetical protein
MWFCKALMFFATVFVIRTIAAQVPATPQPATTQPRNCLLPRFQQLATSTSGLMVAKQYPTDQSGEAKFFTAIYPTTLTFVPQGDGSRELTLKCGVRIRR